MMPHQSIAVDIAAIFGFHAGVDCYINHIYNDNVVQTSSKPPMTIIIIIINYYCYYNHY